VKGPALATASDLSIRTSEPPRFHVLSRLRDVFVHRELLANLVRKEVKVKYKSSILGMLWSMLNPLLYLAVFSLVRTVAFKRGVPNFAVYLLSGLLAWSLFGSSLGHAARSVVENASLVTKVYFPREILPLAAVGAALVDFGIHGVVLVGFMILTGAFVGGMSLLLLPLSIMALLTLASALGMWTASLNVRYRDTQHLLGLVLLVWFWTTPIIYPPALVQEQFAGRDLFGVSLLNLYLANPMAGIVMGFQRALYGLVSPEGQPVLLQVSVEWLALVIGGVAVGSLVLLFLAWRTFFHLSGDFAEEL
jgi:ABC-2 type transport system permease protein